MSEYQVGDKVVHWNYGLGEIIGMDVKFIHGRDTQCYVVKIGELTIWAAADDPAASSLRMPTPENQFGQLFTILQGEGEPLPEDRFDRKAYLAERMKDGELTTMCSVIRDLFHHGHVKKLNDYDKSTLERAENFLLTEWMFCLSVPQLQAKNEMNQLLGVV